MKILFSSSESKSKKNYGIKINKDSFIFKDLYDERLKVLDRYQNFIDTSTNEQISKLFGTKKQDLINYYKGYLLNKSTIKAIERYSGVAFKYLKYEELSIIEKNYIDNNVIIFSNLFGPILAGDIGIPDYKLKQGEKINNFSLEKFYSNKFSKHLDEYFNNEEILDLRAGFYEKFYKLNKPYNTIKFIKNGKVVSHWAKAYRGIVLNKIVKNNIQSIKQLINMDIDNLSIEEIKRVKFKKEIIYSIQSE